MSKTILKLVSREFDGFERSFAHQIKAFQQDNPDVEIQAEFYDLATHHERMIAQRGAAEGIADLFLCVTDWLPEAIDQGLLTPLNEYISSDPPEDWPDGWSPSMLGLQTAPDGQIYGLPYHDGPEIFMYRTDLFESPAEHKAFQEKFGYELGPPRNWKQFIEVAQFFTRPVEGLWGTCMGGYPDAHNNIYDFMLHLWSRGGKLLGPDNEPLFASEQGRQALQFLVDLYHKHRVVSLECLKLDSIASGMYYASGKVAMMWNWSGFAAIAETPQASSIVGKNSTTTMPKAEGPDGRAVSLNIYWVLGLCSGSKNKEIAYRFMRHTCSREMDKATSMLGANGTRLSTWRDPEVREKYPYYKIIEEVHGNVESPPKIATFPAIAESLNQTVDDALNLRSDVPSALERAADEVRQLSH